MKAFRCFLGFHKWTFESKTLHKHERKANYDSVYSYFVYGQSKFYEYECELCGHTQWYSIGTSLNGYHKMKIKKPV